MHEGSGTNSGMFNTQGLQSHLHRDPKARNKESNDLNPKGTQEFKGSKASIKRMNELNNERRTALSELQQKALMSEGGKIIDCSYCGGTGAAWCVRCEGDGAVVCPVCEGNSNRVCRTCEGEGVVSEQTCKTCNGSGNAVCKTCQESGKITCSLCLGTGGKNCKYCHGAGKVFVDQISPIADSLAMKKKNQ